MKRFALLPLLLLTLSACVDEPTVPAATGPIRLDVVAATADVVACNAAIPVTATATSGPRPFPNLLLNFNVLAGGGSVFGGAAMTDGRGVAKDIWTIGRFPGRLNTLAVRAVDGSTGVGTTYFTQTVKTGTGSKISFYSNATGSGSRDLFVMHADGTALTRLTAGSDSVLSTDWSPDGSTIVFVRGHGGTSDTEIYVMNADGTDEHRLTNNSANDDIPSWSPDGSKIAFSRDNGSGFGIYVMNADGSGVQLLHGGYTSDWSPDGSRIVFTNTVGSVGGGNEIWIMNADGSDARQVTYTGASILNAAWSPDGRRIVFDSDLGVANGPRDIFVVNPDGSGLTNLTNDNPIAENWPRWSPDGRKIVFNSNRGTGNTDLYVMNADGSDPQGVGSYPAHMRRVAWSGCLAF